MAKQKKGANNQSTGFVSSEEKIARLLALLAIKGIEQKSDQVLMLRSAGFSSSEVSTLLRISENNIAVMEYRERNRNNKKKAR